MKLKRLPNLYAAFAAILLLTACAGDPAQLSSLNGKLQIVTTTTQIASMAQEVAGSGASVRSILMAGADPHSFEPRPSDIIAVAHAAVVFKNGAGLDDWMDKMLENAGGSHELVTVSRGVPIHKGDETDPLGDPHIWFSAANAVTMTLNIRDALVQADPTHAGTYRANTESYVARLKALDLYIQTQINTVPPDNRKLVSNHDVFGYYVERYGLQFVGSVVPSMTTDAQPSSKDIADLIEKIRAQHVKAIFLENSINPSLAQQIGRDAGVKVVDTLFGDALGAAGTPGATYEGMMRYDTDTIVAALK